MSFIGGDWDVSFHTDLKCCLEVVSLIDTILVSIHYRRRGTLRRLLSAGFSTQKGASPLRGATVTVARLGPSGDRRMARPCEDCQQQLRQYGVKYIIYTTDGGWLRERL